MLRLKQRRRTLLHPRRKGLVNLKNAALIRCFVPQHAKTDYLSHIGRNTPVVDGRAQRLQLLIRPNFYGALALVVD